jgi:hypothetical protein
MTSLRRFHHSLSDGHVVSKCPHLAGVTFRYAPMPPANKNPIFVTDSELASVPGTMFAQLPSRSTMIRGLYLPSHREKPADEDLSLFAHFANLADQRNRTTSIASREFAEPPTESNIC